MTDWYAPYLINNAAISVLCEKQTLSVTRTYAKGKDHRKVTRNQNGCLMRALKSEGITNEAT